MATDIIPIGEVQDSLRIREEDAFDALADAAMDPVVALQAVTGMRANSVLYQFSMGGSPVVGFTVKGAKALMARRGGFEVHEPVLENVMVPATDADGTWVDVPGVRATVRVTDKRNDNTFCASVARARVKILRNGDKKIDEHCEANAVARATRNAILDHFAGITDTVMEFVKQAQKDGKVYVMGAPDEQMEEVSRQQAVNRAKRKAMHSTPLGNLGREVFLSELRETAQEAGMAPEALKPDLDAFQNAQWPGLKLAEIPASDRPLLDAWLMDKRRQLGLAVQEDVQEDAPALPSPAAGEQQETDTHEDQASDEPGADEANQQGLDFDAPAPEPQPAPKGRTARKNVDPDTGEVKGGGLDY